MVYCQSCSPWLKRTHLRFNQAKPRARPAIVRIPRHFARRLRWPPASAPGILIASAQLHALTLQRGLYLEPFSFANGEELRAFDARLLEIIPTNDPWHKWCVAAPRFFHRERPHRRVVYLTAEEAATTATAISRAHSALTPASDLVETASTSSTSCSLRSAASDFARALLESRSDLVPTTR